MFLTVSSPVTVFPQAVVSSFMKSLVLRKLQQRLLPVKMGHTTDDSYDKPVLIDKWDSGAVKNAFDDGAKKVLVDMKGYKESNKIMDGRLLICTVAVGFALFAVLWDYLYPFPQSKAVLMTCALAYFVLMGILTLYLTYIEKGVFLVALEQDKARMEPDNKWMLSSSLQKYDDTYHLTMHFIDGKTKEERSSSVSKRVDNYIDEKGMFCFDLYLPVIEKLRKDLANEKKKL